MDITQAKTFLTIIELRSFKRAADKLFVTQSTVSARIKALEEQLNSNLFIRNKAGVTLTPAARKFERHAQSIVNLWDHAKREVLSADSISHSITIGARYGLWDPLLLNLLDELYSNHHEIEFKARIGTANTLIQQIHNGTMDVCIVYSPYINSGLKIQKLFIEKFVMVSSNTNTTCELDEEYAYVYWGTEFAREHNLHFPDSSSSRISVNMGALAEKLILKTDVKGYLPIRTIKSSLKNKKLHIVEDAPIISIPVYMIYSELLPENITTSIVSRLLNLCNFINIDETIID